MVAAIVSGRGGTWAVGVALTLRVAVQRGVLLQRFGEVEYSSRLVPAHAVVNASHVVELQRGDIILLLGSEEGTGYGWG